MVFPCPVGPTKAMLVSTGAEAVETAVKISRKWAYEVKGIDTYKAKIIVCENNFHGRTTTIISFSNDPVARKNFGPYTEGFIKIEYDNLQALEAALESSADIAGFLVEPIQGEAGVVVPFDGYMAEVKKLCEKYNVLFELVIPRERILKGPISGVGIQSIFPGVAGLYLPVKIPLIPTEI